MTGIWGLKNSDIYKLWYLFEKINFQGRNKYFFQSNNPNEFGEVPYTIGCKIPMGTVS